MKVNEVAGIGNGEDFGTRAYNTRTGIFPSRDPYTVCTPWASPYSFAGNSPIRNIDYNGEFKVSPYIKENFKNVYAYLRDRFETDMAKSADVYKVFQYRTNATREDIARDFKDGSGVALISETSPSYDNYQFPSDAVEFYSKKFKRIEVNERVLKYVDDILGSPTSTKMNKQQALLLLNMVILHSEAHNLEENFGENSANRGRSTGFPLNSSDPGYDVEFMLYSIKRRPLSEPGKSDLPGVRSQNNKLSGGVLRQIIKDSEGDEGKTSNLPSVPRGEKEIGSPGTGTGTH